MVAITKPKSSQVSTSPLPSSLSDLFWSKATYQHVANDFHLFHQHDLNVAAHLITTTIGMWGGFVLLLEYGGGLSSVLAYTILVALTTPVWTAIFHTALCCAMVAVTPAMVQAFLQENTTNLLDDKINIIPDYVSVNLNDTWQLGIAAIVIGFVFQELSHYLADEQTFMSSYMALGKPWMLLIHTVWLLPLVVESITMRHFFLPKLLVTRNRNVICNSVHHRTAIESLRLWIHENVPSTPETTHVWPHAQTGTAGSTVLLEEDPAIETAFRSVFATQHFDVKPIQGMSVSDRVCWRCWCYGWVVRGFYSMLSHIYHSIRHERNLRNSGGSQKVHQLGRCVLHATYRWTLVVPAGCLVLPRIGRFDTQRNGPHPV